MGNESSYIELTMTTLNLFNLWGSVAPGVFECMKCNITCYSGCNITCYMSVCTTEEVTRKDEEKPAWPPVVRKETYSVAAVFGSL